MVGKFANSLDEDCWEIIFSRLSTYSYRHDFASVSLVCKRFLSITNRLKHNLRVSNLTAPLLPKVLRRFHQLKSIEITTDLHEDCNNIILEIARSRLQHFETLVVSCSKIFPRAGIQILGMNMKVLKKLDLSEFCFWCDDDLIALADWFPILEELNLSGLGLINSIDCQPIIDRGLEVLTSKVKGLKKMTLGHCSEITDQSLVSISSNCVNLIDFSVRLCPRLTENGIRFLLRNSSKLTSLALQLSAESLSDIGGHFTIENSNIYARNLEEIRIFGMTIPDGLLSSIATSCPRLKKIFLNPSLGAHNFTMQGLRMLLRTCSSLRDVSLRLSWLTDDCILDVIEHIRGLTQIDLDGCSMLSSVTLFMLIKNCPLLESLEMDGTMVGTYEDFDVHLHRNYRVKTLRISRSNLMNDRTLSRIVSTCPNLEFLYMRSCVSQDLTNDGIAKCLDVCPQLQHLDVSDLNVSNFLGPHEECILKLKSIQASYSCIDDEALEMISKRCPVLENLVIEGCDFVTNHGMKRIVSKCEKLEKINMNQCENISGDLLNWLVKTRPSLKEIVTPCDFVANEEQRYLILRNGCLFVTTNNDDDLDEDESDDEVEV